MSRVAEFDEIDEDDEGQRAYEKEVREAYAQPKVVEQLKTFLAFLDAMPVKEICADRFWRPRDGAMCSVAAFCKSAGKRDEDLRKTEAQSRLERFEHQGSEENNGWDGATVAAGEAVGLPHEVAFDLVWKNEIVWDVNPDKRYTTEEVDRHGVLVKHVHFPKMTDAERWLRLRNFVAKRVRAEPIEAS